MNPNEAVERVLAYNEGRELERLHMKYERMALDPFTFFRGSCHLFYEDLPPDGVFAQGPVAWGCGDLHLENFGTYKGDNQLAYFDMNDFDEGGLAPIPWELSRFLTSLWLASERIGVSADQALELEHRFIASYSGTLASGKARWVERDTASGMIRDLFGQLQSQKAFLDGRTRFEKGQRQLKLQADRALKIKKEERQMVFDFIGGFAKTQSQSKFYNCLDVARRVAGTGSLGLRRYVVLIEGDGAPDGHILLDLKEAIPSALEPHLVIEQPEWTSPAARTVAIQQRMQAITPALLQPVDFEGSSWILRELQPSKDRLRLDLWNGRLKRLEQVVDTMGQVVAAAQLRSSGRQGSAIADVLMGFATESAWKQGMVEYAEDYSETVRGHWRAFRRWWKGQEGKNN